MNYEEIANKFNEVEWRFAKTMPEHPHSYTLRKDWESNAEFDMVVNYIREHGKEEPFWKARYIYLYIGDYKYWTMGAPINETILINKAKV